MGGRGGSSGISAEKARSQRIKKEFLEQGLNSKIAGIREKAENGTGNYSFKNAQAVDYEQAKKMTTSKVIERNENTLIEGYLESGKHVFYANSSNSSEIKYLKELRSTAKDTTLRPADLTGKTTTTYDNWLKRRRKKFDDWYKR